MKLEHRRQKVATLPQFLFRLGRYALFALLLIFISVLIGTFGYHYLSHISWLDSFHMACMILTGMGPVVEMANTRSQTFFIILCPIQWCCVFKYHSSFLCPNHS